MWQGGGNSTCNSQSGKTGIINLRMYSFCVIIKLPCDSRRVNPANGIGGAERTIAAASARWRFYSNLTAIEAVGVGKGRGYQPPANHSIPDAWNANMERMNP
ncbi:MAG TPA: hypothetical protein PKJ47_12630, partial [Candidatus Limiplasma sp.]|nr:hypothetical protein [Candidatus Limiplasma sp.]